MIARLVVLVAAIGAGVFGIVRGTWAVGGSDSSCYALMAEAFARGELQPVSRLSLEAPWPDAPRTFAPGGFIPSPVRPGASSPICAPGFALLLAPFRALAGRDAIFLLTPTAGSLLVWLTFAVCRRIADEWTAAAAAVMMATAPVLLFQIVQPMNDVTVAALWMAAVAALARPYGGAEIMPRVSRRDAMLAGACAGAALLVRPNLAPLAAVMLVWIGWAARSWRVAALSAAALSPFVLMALTLNAALYGHPFAQGYGDTRELFAVGHLAANAGYYGRALFETQLAFPLLALAAPLALPARARPLMWLMLGAAAAVTVVYLLYRPFPEWWYLRFFLPVLPLTIALAVAVVAAVAGARAAAFVAAVVVLYAAASGATQQAWDLQRLESRFRLAGEVARERLPENAFIVTVWESGSVRYHAGREAMLWDALDAMWLDDAVDWLSSRGFETFLMLEEWEEPLFRERFATRSPLGQLDWPPRFDIDRQVRLFSPRDRARYLAGEPVPTELVRGDRR